MAVADSNPAALRAAGALASDATAFEDYRELVARDEIDAVIVAVPTHLHARVATEVFGARKHLYLEKPLARSVAEGRQLVDCWRETGRVGIIGFNYRFSPLFLRLRDRIARGAVGEVVAVRMMFASAPATLPDWKTRRTTGGGAPWTSASTTSTSYGSSSSARCDQLVPSFTPCTATTIASRSISPSMAAW